ncbi:hypothetical protein [Agrobacterium rubi]|uniref:Uncharacterized protein n=1 Tax=Agrobacterium rubi TaxID=28099 RepID=A0ABX2J9D9_9HYPH|nr:hypothetical protein [Agrobacterium rubi]NTE89346.1 hypothetical protein [Agrobacterium rubi]NTF39482.1 hypothetical protein [Agrobacterium rubi]
MGTSGPAKGQDIARRSREGLRMVRPAFKRAATDAGLPCDEAMILPQRGAKAAFDRGAPMSDRSKTEVLCRPTIWFTTA